MKALLPSYCRPVGYLVIALGLFVPMTLMLLGYVTDANLLLYKECAKLLMMVGALMIIFAYNPRECKETEQARNKAVRNALFITFFLIFANMLYRVAHKDMQLVDSSSFLIFLLVHVLCLEFGLKKVFARRLFKGDGR